MTIREYFDNMYDATTTDAEFDEVTELQNVMYNVLVENEDDFTIWADEEGIDLTATEIIMGEEYLVLTTWCWDMCGD